MKRVAPVAVLTCALLSSAACELDGLEDRPPESEDYGDTAAIAGHFIEIGDLTTWLKKTTAQSSTLELANEKCRLYAGSVVPIQDAPEVNGNHYLVNTRRIIPGCGFSRGYVYIPHVVASSAGGGDGGGSLLRPVPGPVSSYYGPRNGGFHYGLDIAAPTGTPIRNPAGGTLQSQSYAGGCGNSFQVGHSDGLRSRYCHLSAYAGVVGRYYARGTTLGRVGNTGNSTGPHLHVELYLNGQIRDPLSIAPHWD